jgi:type I restriction enzyme S subunit
LISAAGTIGRTVVYDGEPAYFQDSNIIWIDNDESKMTNKYLFHLYEVANWHTTDGGIISRLYNDIIRETRLQLPPLNEQTAIVERLSATDKEIVLLKRELEQQRQVKKHLMQQLLTGRKRIKAASAA